MDNASKALIMAGAVLIAVMLISLGVYMFQAAKTTATGVSQQLDVQVTNAYNDRYATYFGPDQSLNDVQALVQLVNAHNSNKKERDQFDAITIEGTNIISGANNGSYGVTGTDVSKIGHYDIHSTGSGKNGGINAISISKVSAIDTSI